MSQKDFHFIGKAPLSKSLLNRALIIKSWYPNFVIHGSSSCDDVLIMEAVVKKMSQLGLSLEVGGGDSRFRGNDGSLENDGSLGNDGFVGDDDLKSGKQKKEFYCGLSGTAFRFLAVRLSREKGEFVLKADKALFKRPLEEAQTLFSQISVSMEKTERAYVISSDGWKLQGDCLYVPSKMTSQWASALLLNCWNLEKDLYFVLSPSSVSYSYFKLTLIFVKSLGLIVQQKDNEFFIPKGQSLKAKEYCPEQDKSCLFALACFAVLNGKAVFLDWEQQSLQADHIFPDILKAMDAPVELKKDQSSKSFENIDSKFSSGIQNSRKNGQLNNDLTNSNRTQLTISKCDSLKALDMSLKKQPDLFPMLAVLCAKAEGQSILRDISHLAFKESNRIQKIKELLEKCGIQVKIQKADFLIYGQNEWNQEISSFVFDTEQDHRLVMAGSLIASMGVPITLKGKSAVNKSFPDFFSFISS